MTHSTLKLIRLSANYVKGGARMMHSKNERGSTLFMVLMLVIVFTILGIGVLSLNISASKQFDKKEEQVQARHQAEMGVLHYQNQLKERVKTHNNEIKKIVEDQLINKASRIKDENKKLCLTLNDTVEKIKSPVNPDGGKYEVSKNGGIDCSIPGMKTITIYSKGEAGENGESLIEADLTLKIPENTHITEDEESIPTPPPSTGNVIKEWPCIQKNEQGSMEDCDETLNDYVEVGNVAIDKGDLKFNDHFVADTLRIGSGNGANITVAKDLYIKELLSIQNQLCLSVQGNLTIQNKLEIQSNGQIYIFVYGDAFFPTKPGKNGNYFVNGNVYFGGVKQTPNPYTSVPNLSESNKCKLPGLPEIEVDEWDYIDGIDAEYKS